MDKQIVVVGDIHGCLEEFEELLKTLQYNKEKMRLILLGDLLDRGPDPVGCIRKARELGVECIQGNHEEKHLRWHKHELKSKLTGKDNPMRPLAPEALLANQSLSDEDWKWLESLPVKIHLDHYWWALHGGCEPRFTLDKQDPKQIIRVRYVDENGKAKPLNPDKSQPEGTSYWTEKWNGPESIIYGHCVHNLEKPRIDFRPSSLIEKPFCIGIDTGCCFGGHLTAAVFNTPEFIHVTGTKDIEMVQVKAKKKYYEGYSDE